MFTLAHDFKQRYLLLYLLTIIRLKNKTNETNKYSKELKHKFHYTVSIASVHLQIIYN